MTLDPVWADGKIRRSAIVPEIAQKVATTVFNKSDHFQNCQKVAQIFWLLLYENLSPRPFKNSPIWSHWLELDF